MIRGTRNGQLVSLMMLASSVLVARVDAQTRPTAFFGIASAKAGAHLGGAVSDAGDVDKDGYQDVLVGAPEDLGQGVGSVYSGKSSALIWSIASGSAGDRFGQALAGVGDLNADGHDDFLIGGPQTATGNGIAIVFSGKTGGALYKLAGDQKNDEFGFAAAGIGDVNLDGVLDFAVGAPRTIGGSPAYARVFSGKDGSPLYTVKGSNLGDQFGTSLRAVGLLDGDACPDFVVGAPADNGDRGYASLVSGCTGGIITSFQGAAASDRFGAAVSGVGDVDHDGVDDLCVGAPGDDTGFTDAGSATVLSGKTNLVLCTVRGEKPGSLLGSSVGGGCDVDSDGTPEFILGAPSACGGGDLGYALVARLVGASCVSVYRANGDAAGDAFGASVSTALDMNQDGFDDFLIGAPCNDAHAGDGGLARVFSGRLCPASWNNYGSGFAGTLCEPSLTASGSPIICATVTLDITNCAGQDTTALLLAGLTPGNIPNPSGGTLLVSPPWVFRPFTLPAAGLSVPVTILCDTAFCGLTIYTQVLEIDAGAGGPNQDISSSKGLALVLGGS